eukprot:387588-Pelagomonas_calceolata.AAC.3
MPPRVQVQESNGILVETVAFRKGVVEVIPIGLFSHGDGEAWCLGPGILFSVNDVGIAFSAHENRWASFELCLMRSRQRAERAYYGKTVPQVQNTPSLSPLGLIRICASILYQKTFLAQFPRLQPNTFPEMIMETLKTKVVDVSALRWLEAAFKRVALPNGCSCYKAN